MNAKHWIQPEWPAPLGIHAAISLRTGGFSTGAYASMNTALHVGDEPEAVKQNRAFIKNGLKLPNEPLWLQQTHSSTAVDAAEASQLPQPIEADASYTDQPGLVCAVMTADCLPVLVCSTDGKHIAAIHAGWKGLAAGIITKTIAAMDAQDVLVWLGPAIGPNCFEVGDDVKQAFVEKSAANATAFKPQTEGKWLADIYQLARIELASLGINKTYGGGFCTVTESERFYSYRRDQITGRMVTLIWMEKPE